MASATAATYESEEERSLLFSDSEQESISHADDNYTNDDDDQDNSTQWEDFMVRYWTSNNNDHGGNNNDHGGEDEEFQITAQADEIVMMENTDMVPHPLEPELDNSCDEFLTKTLDFDNSTNNSNDILLMKIFSEVGLQGTLQMAKLHAAANDHAHQPTNNKSTAAAAAGGSTKKELLQKKKQLQDEFTIDMTNIPISAKPKKKKKRSKGTTTAATSGGGIGMKMQQLQINQDGAARNNNYHQSPRQEQQQETLEDSLFAMAQRLSPGNNDNLSQQQQQHKPDDVRSTKSSVQSVTSSSFSNNTTITNNNNNYSPLPNPDLIHQMGPIQTRTSLRSLLMKKWHPSWWMHYDTHSLLIFRSKDHLDDWVQNPYHGKRERAYLVKLRVDFGDIVGGGNGGGGGSSVANNNSQNQQGSNNSGDANNNNTTNKDGSRILGHRILPIKKKSYHKNEPEMYQFKLERWTNMGVSVLAAFASEEEEDVQVLYDTIVEIMSTCPHGGLHNIDHMLQH